MYPTGLARWPRWRQRYGPAALADDAEIDAHLAAIPAGELDLTLAPLISAWGRRTAEHPPALG